MLSLEAGPALEGAGPNARLRRGVPLSSILWRHRAQSTVLRRFWENGLYEYQNTRRIIGIDLYVDDITSILLIWKGVDIANVSPNYVHVYD